MKCSARGAEQLTVESATIHFELLEVCESAPLGRDSTRELVGIVQSPITSVIVATAKIEHLQ